MTARGDASRMAAGIASIAAHERALADAARLDAERAAARPAPPEITGRPGRPERALAQTVRCPFASCHAPVGEPCRTATGRRLTSGPHPSRLDAARAAALPQETT